MLKKFKTREEWLDYRAGKDIGKMRVGGTALCSILGKNRYCSPLQLWHIHTGREDGTIEDNEPMKLGRHMEEFVISYIIEELKAERIDEKDDLYVYEHPDDPRKHGSPDTMLSYRGKSRMTEIKTTQLAVEEPLDYWIIQSNYNLGLALASGVKLDGHLIAWYSSSKHEVDYREYDFDPELFEHSLASIDEFFGQVDNDTPPPPMMADDFANYRESIKDSSIEADELAEKMLYSLFTIKEAEDELKARKEVVQIELKRFMDDKEYVMLADVKLCTFKSGTKNMLDTKKLKADHPELCAKYINTVKTRTLRPNYKYFKG
jgi:predicted phage-related endonuclease